jgi:N-acetyl-gamma-glutamyl-phosphate reductase
VNKYSPAPVGIVGFRGYSGAELVQILKRHKLVEPVLLEHRSDHDAGVAPLGRRPDKTATTTPEAVKQEGLKLIFLATPPEVSMELAPAYLEAGAKVIDLSGAFRLGDADTYRRWYKSEHKAPHLLSQAVYGLPEFYRENIAGKNFISNPGCYPTAASIALRPLAKAEVIDRTRGIVCDAKSGVSGAGRKASLKTSFVEVTENFSAYSILEHRHVPEVLQNTGLGEREFTFTAQLIPVARGILETIYVRVQGVNDAVDLLNIYEDQYADEPFVRLYAPGKVPDLRAVRHTNFCDIGFVFDKPSKRVVIVSAIDNLVKGAAGQAVQNMNLALGFRETEGLL